MNIDIQKSEHYNSDLLRGFTAFVYLELINIHYIS